MIKGPLQFVGSALLVSVSFFPLGVFSWVPPRSAHSNLPDPTWESVHAMRARLGISYNYTPSLLHPELCRNIPEDECEHHDLAMQRHAQSHRNRALQSKPGDNPNLGKVKVLVLLTQFTDHTEDRVLIEKPEIEDRWKNDVERWFKVNSQGAYEIEPVIVDWMMTDNTEEYYSFDVMGIVPELQQAMHPLLDELDKRQGWDWSQFDSDGDGRLDGVVMMHSGYDAVVAGEDCQGRDAMQRIFPHAFTSTGDINGWTSADGSVSLAGYAVASAFDGDCDGKVFAPGLICHEYMHTMGLIDLYDQEDVFQAKGIGAWDIMADPYGHDNSGDPGFLSVWSREQVEWMSPEKIEYDGFYTLKPAETSAQAYRIYLLDFGPGWSEYFLIENRQKISFDENLWDEGLVIYHVDEAADGMMNRGFPGQPGWPDNGNHYFLAVMQKDGLYGLEQNENSGDAGDMWLPDDVLGPGKGGTAYPNTDGYQSGIIIENGLTIRVDSQRDNGDVVFEVTGLAPAPADATNQEPPPESDNNDNSNNGNEGGNDGNEGGNDGNNNGNVGNNNDQEPIDQTSAIVPSPGTPAPAATEDPVEGTATEEPVDETSPLTTASPESVVTDDSQAGGATTPVSAATPEPTIPDVPAAVPDVPAAMAVIPATTIFESNGGPLLSSAGFSIFATRIGWSAALVLAVALPVW